MKWSNVSLWYLINLVLHPYLKSFIKSCLIIENWHFVPLLTYELAFLGLSVMHFQHQCLPQNHGVSPSRPQVHPTWMVWDAHWGVHVPGVSGNCIPGHRHKHSIRTVGRGCFSFLFKDPSAEWLGLLPSFSTCSCEALPPRIITRCALNFLSSSFYKLWILWDLCKHPKVALIEVNDSLLLIKK